LGNQDGAFSKVGDSITATPNFLAELGSPSFDLTLLGGHTDLAPTIAFYREHIVDSLGNNSFDHISLAATPAWQSATLLSGPFGGSPLVAEFSATHPSLALIMIGTNDVIHGVDPEAFRANLTRITDIAMSMGVIPVLSTIPEMTGQLAVFNGRVAAFN